MAGDTRDGTSLPQTPIAVGTNTIIPDGKAIGGKQHAPSFPENANALPGGTVNSAGGRPQHAGVVDAAKTIKLSDFTEIHKKPCVRDAFLSGIFGGFMLGGGRAILGGKHPLNQLLIRFSCMQHIDNTIASVVKASNWAVGTFCATSFVVYEMCMYRRSVEKEGMKRAAVIIDRKKIEKERMMEERRARRRKAKEEHDAKMEAQKRSNWWKPW
jgi:cytochrome c oxidase assembly protein subunit 20